MERKSKLRKIDIKNNACYYFNYIIRVIAINLRDILLDEKKYENISIYDISYKTFIGSISLLFRFDERYGFLKTYDGIRYLVLFGVSLYDRIFDRIKCLISKKGGITDIIDHNFARIRTDSYNFLPIEKILTFHNVMILIKSVFNENKNNSYYDTFSRFVQR